MLKSQRQKTAMVIAKAMAHCGEHGLPIEAEMLGARIQALAESNRIEDVGDLRR
jgi:hypothetical protein